MITIDLMAVGQILGAIATFAAIVTFLRAQKKAAQDEGAAMQKIKDMQEKLECHDGQIEELEKSDKEKDVIIAEIQSDLRHIIEKIDDLSRRLEKFMERSK